MQDDDLKVSWWVRFQSWPIGEEPPMYYVSGYDEFERARKACAVHGVEPFIREVKLFVDHSKPRRCYVTYKDKYKRK